LPRELKTFPALYFPYLSNFHPAGFPLSSRLLGCITTRFFAEGIVRPGTQESLFHLLCSGLDLGWAKLGPLLPMRPQMPQGIAVALCYLICLFPAFWFYPNLPYNTCLILALLQFFAFFGMTSFLSIGDFFP